MTNSPPAALLGWQQPRLLHLPTGAVSNSAVETIELAASTGLELDPAQCLVLEAALGERVDGLWSAFEVGVTEPRQNGKGDILLARSLGGLYLFGEQLILHSAHEFKTSWEAFLRLRDRITNTDDLRRKVRQIRQSNQDVSIELLTGQRIRFVARSKGSGRGFTGDCVLLDESMFVTPSQMGALVPTLAAVPNPQLWYTGSAPLRASVVQHALRRRALQAITAVGRWLPTPQARLAYAEWSIDPLRPDPTDPTGRRMLGVDDPDDEQSIAKANPALGRRITIDMVRAEKAAMPRDEYLRERLGVADPDPEEAGDLVPADVWAELADPTSEWVGTPVAVVDVSPGEASASIAFAGMRADGLRHVELVDNAPGTGWIADRRTELTARYGVHTWLRDPAGPAVGLTGEWEDITARQWTAACGGFLGDVLTGKQLRWRCAGDLEAALDAARSALVQVNRGDGATVWARKRTETDISPMVVLTIGWLLADSGFDPSRSVH